MSRKKKSRGPKHIPRYNDAIVIESKKLSKAWEKRYVVIRESTEEVLDDAQGYGYKSKQAAYRGYAYKSRDVKKYNQKQARIKSWVKEYKDFLDWMTDASFYALKDGEDFGVAEVKSMLEAENLELDGFTAQDLYNYWLKR